MLIAAALVARVLHQPLPVVKAMPLRELYTWEAIAKAMEGIET